MSGLIHDTEEHKALRDTVAKIASSYGQRYFLERSRANEDITELWRDLGDAGLLGVHLPEQYGGGGAGMREAVVVVEELAAHGMPMLIWVISPAMVGSVLAAHGSEQVKQAWLPGIIDGTRKVAFGLTEPDAGSNSHEVKTTATRDGDGWRISGSKYYISAIDQCDAILLVTRDEQLSTPDKRALSIFVIPTDTPGLTYQKIDTSVVSPDNSSRSTSTTYASAPRPWSARRARACGRCSRRSIPNGSWSVRSPPASGGTRSRRPPTTPGPARCGPSRSASTRASPTRWPRRT